MAKARTGIPQRHLILSVTALDQELRDRLENETKALGTPDQVLDFVVQSNKAYFASIQDPDKQKDIDAPWQFRWLAEQHFRVGLLTYKGNEIALLFRRQYSYYTQDTEGIVDAIPGKTLKTLDEAWIRVSLTEAKSSFKQAQFFTSDFKKLEDERDQLQRRTQTQANLIAQQEERICTLERVLDAQKGK